MCAQNLKQTQTSTTIRTPHVADRPPYLPPPTLFSIGLTVVVTCAEATNLGSFWLISLRRTLGAAAVTAADVVAKGAEGRRQSSTTAINIRSSFSLSLSLWLSLRSLQSSFSFFLSWISVPRNLTFLFLSLCLKFSSAQGSEVNKKQRERIRESMELLGLGRVCATELSSQSSQSNVVLVWKVSFVTFPTMT